MKRPMFPRPEVPSVRLSPLALTIWLVCGLGVIGLIVGAIV